MSEQTKSASEQISGIVKWYSQIPVDYRNIDNLTKGLRKLACALFDYSVEVGRLYTAAHGMEYARKTAFERKRLELIGDGKSVSAAEAEAKASIENDLFSETVADSEYRSAQMQLSAARDVLEAMRQHIASLKLEYKLESAGNGQQ